MIDLKFLIGLFLTDTFPIFHIEEIFGKQILGIFITYKLFALLYYIHYLSVLNIALSCQLLLLLLLAIV